MLLKICHRTEYHYDIPVPYALQQVRMIPKSTAAQSVLSWNTNVEGGKKQVAYTDQHNNHVELFSFDPECTSVIITSSGEVDTADSAGIVGPHHGFAPLWYFQRSTPLTKAGPHVRSLVKSLGNEFERDTAQLHALSTLILSTVAYTPGKTDFSTRAEQAIEAGHGVCQDHAHIFISAARLLGFPARYVSGYLMMDEQVDQSAGHAWVEAYVDGLGWVGFDVSNGISPDERYVRVATGLDFTEAAPVSGITFGGHQESMIVSLQVQQ